MPGRFSVPDRRPRSCPPPSASGRSASAGRTSSAPTPAGPPILWPESATRSASASGAGSSRPAPCTASTWTRAPAARASRIASATGWTTPVSLFTHITDTSAGASSAARRRSRSARSRRPSASTAIRSAPSATASTASCSIAETSSRGRPGPRTASASASVPPEVNTTCSGGRPTSAATRARAASRRPRAARPAACTDDGLPTARAASAMASRAAGRTGVVALWSR